MLRLPLPQKKKAYIYTRVSTMNQAIEGQSLETQCQMCEEWINKHPEYKFEKIFADKGTKGYKENRKELNELRKVVKKGDVIVLYSLHRLARRLQLWLHLSEEMKKKGVRLVCVHENIDTDDKNISIVGNMIALLAQYEVEQIQERTKHNFDGKRKRGELCNGKACYGYGAYKAMNGLLYSYPSLTEQKGIDVIINHKDGGRTWSQISDFLFKNGYPTKCNSLEWNVNSLRKIYNREKDMRERFPFLNDHEKISKYEKYRAPHIVPEHLIEKYLTSAKFFDHESYNNRYHPGANYSANHYVPTMEQLKTDVENGNFKVTDEEKLLIRNDFDEERCKEFEDPVIKRIINDPRTKDLYISSSNHMPDLDTKRKFAMNLAGSFGIQLP